MKKRVEKKKEWIFRQIEKHLFIHIIDENCYRNELERKLDGKI
jgi:hypothetical protein